MKQIIRNRIIYEVRESNSKRGGTLFNFFLKDFPRRIARGLLNTPSSQPPLVTLKAYSALLSIMPRLISKRIDHKKWINYLDTLQWKKIEFETQSRDHTNISGAL
jgi:hypothetical protein